MPWSNATIQVQNRSAFPFTPQQIYVDGELEPLTALPINGKSGKLTSLKPKVSATTAATLIRLQSPDTAKDVVVYLAMNTSPSALAFEVAQFAKAEPANPSNLVQSLISAPDHEELGFVLETDLAVTDSSNVVHNIAVSVSYTSFEPTGQPEDEDDDPLNTEPNPVVTIDIVDSEFLKAEDRASGITDFKIAAGPLHLIGQPIHENISLCALIAAGLVAQGSTYDNVLGAGKFAVAQPDNWEYLRGVIWNDDPACLLFINFPGNNGLFNDGLEWLVNFKSKGPILQTAPITRRSHFGDMQFLHAMATKEGEEWNTTKDKIMVWLQIMYKLSIGEGVSPGDTLSKHFGTLFTAKSKPKGSATLAALLQGRTTAYKANISRRALGSCFHLIQDSYAIGHCDRNLATASDRTGTGASLAYKPNTRFLDVNNFHCYSGQDEKKHGEFDKVKNYKVLKPSDPTTFKDVVGARDAIDKCTKLALFHKNKTPWASGVQKFLSDEVFNRPGNAAKSNKNVGP